MRKLSLTDRLLDELQHGLSTCHLRPAPAERPYPADAAEQAELSEQEREHIAGLMRVNNAGEVAAQGLYRGQALTARKQALSEAMNHAAQEENEHLNWCQRRLDELDQPRSLLDGVCAHLDRHLESLPQQDRRSRAILEAMRADELQHAENAAQAGAAELPQPIKQAMRLVSKIMTFTAYRI